MFEMTAVTIQENRLDSSYKQQQKLTSFDDGDVVGSKTGMFSSTIGDPVGTFVGLDEGERDGCETNQM